MSIWITLLLFALGIALVVKGGDLFVDSAGWIARASGIPSFIIGATIVSVATTLPEMIVSALAASEGKVDMAVGNAIGSVTANTGLIMAIAMIFMNVICSRKEYLMQCLLLIASATTLLLVTHGGSLKTFGSILLLCIFAVFVYDNIKKAKKHATSEDRIPIDRKSIIINIGKFVLGAAGIVVGSQLLVNSGSEMATLFGVPERVIAVTLVAVGTSLPELVTTITAIAKKEASLSIGNIIGANIIDLTLILPVCSLVSRTSIPVSQQSAAVDIPVCLGVILFTTVPMLIRERAYRWQGAAMVAGYIVYLICVI